MMHHHNIVTKINKGYIGTIKWVARDDFLGQEICHQIAQIVRVFILCSWASASAQTYHMNAYAPLLVNTTYYHSMEPKIDERTEVKVDC